MVRISFFLFLLLIVAAPVMGQATVKMDDKTEVLKVVSSLFDAMKARDAVAVRGLFVPEGRLVATSLRDGAPVVRQLTLEAFAKMVAETKDPYVERMFDTEIRVDGDLATVWGRYDFHVGSRLTNCGVNSFQLVRTTSGWKIIQVASTIRTTGCEKRE